MPTSRDPRTAGSVPSSGALLTVLDALLDGLAWVCKLLTGVALVVLIVIFGWLVFGRYVLNATPTWVEQVSLLIVVLVTFLGAAVGIHENTHLGVSLFIELCPTPLRRVLAFVGHLIVGGFGLVMLLASYKLMIFKWASLIPLIQVPEGVRALPITICGGLVFLFSIGHIVRLLLGAEKRSKLTE
jgi:TRAP-type C4-dicarboxylate transport system permease small subunit